MSTTNPNPDSKLGNNAAALVDSAANTADQAIRSSKRAADDTLDEAAKQVEAAREQAAPALKQLATDAEQLAKRGVEAVTEGTQKLRGQASQATDATQQYIKSEPLKAVLIAAATGAVLMALVALLGRSSTRS